MLHLLEVNVLDSIASNMVGTNFAPMVHTIEDAAVYWFTQHWTTVLVYFFVFIYIVLYPFTLWFSLLYFLLTDQKKSMKTFAFGFLLVYAFALPFYLFLPISNVYTYYGSTSALNTVIPGVEQFFYATTTTNNSFPSLHIAMAFLIANTVALTHNKRFTYIAYISAICVLCSVIYLGIHWIIDVIGGILISFGAFYLAKRHTKET
ncbi:MAG TPA: phosphatase PAP2 family protein [Candidatus Thermoplasmatota archaeon]|nr:phosphatase PAP2 family protein [Candidatus Thermoplasmatota archaeon]